MIKRIFYYTIFLVSFLFIVGTRVAQAVSLPDFSKTGDLPAFISSVYSFALTVVGIAVFIRILYAGFLMLTAAGNSSKWGDARTKMQNAIVGAILLFAAYLILYIINPDLVSNTFKFTIPGSTSTAPATLSEKMNATSGSAGVSGLVPAAGGATSFHSLPIARAQEGMYVFTVKVTDRNGDTCRETYNMEVVPLTAAVNADFYAKHSVAGKYSASILNAVNAQEGGAETTGASFRYLKVETTEDGWVAYREIEAYNTDGKKIKPVNATANSQWCTAADRQAVPLLCNDPSACCDPPNVYDGNENTLWNAGYLNSDGSVRGCLTYGPGGGCARWAPMTDWIKLDYGSVKNFSRIRLLDEGVTAGETRRLLISNDGLNFTKLADLNNGSGLPYVDWFEYQIPPTSPLSTTGTQDGSEIIQTIQSGGCIISTKILPDAVENTPYYAEIVAAGEAPFVYEIEDGSLPDGLGLVAALDMPVLTIKNLTAQRTPVSAFKVGDTFRLDLTNAKPNSTVYFRWFKNGTRWFYPGITPNSEGWSKYGTTDEKGEWANQAAFTSSEIGAWQEYAMVDGKVSRVIEFQVLAPEVKIVVNLPAPGTGAPVYSGGGGGGCAQTPYRCEDKETGEISTLTTEDEVRACSANKSGDERLLWPECVYSGESAGRAECAQYDFEARNCIEQSQETGIWGVDTSNLPHSSDGSPPTDMPAGSLYTTDQYAGSIKLGGDNLLVRCRYSDQVAAVRCGEMSSGEYCLPDGRNAGWNETWCAGKTDASGQIINPPTGKESESVH